MNEIKEKEYRWRIKEGERTLLLKVLARSLQMDIMALWDDNAKELKTYNSSVGHWETRRKIRNKIQEENGTIVKEIESAYVLLQKLSRKRTGRPWIYTGSPLEDYTFRRIQNLCDRVLEGS